MDGVEGLESRARRALQLGVWTNVCNTDGVKEASFGFVHKNTLVTLIKEVSVKQGDNS